MVAAATAFFHFACRHPIKNKMKQKTRRKYHIKRFVASFSDFNSSEPTKVEIRKKEFNDT